MSASRIASLTWAIAAVCLISPWAFAALGLRAPVWLIDAGRIAGLSFIAIGAICYFTGKPKLLSQDEQARAKQQD